MEENPSLKRTHDALRNTRSPSSANGNSLRRLQLQLLDFSARRLNQDGYEELLRILKGNGVALLAMPKNLRLDPSNEHTSKRARLEEGGSNSNPALERKVDMLLARIVKLEQRLAELEGAGGGATVDPLQETKPKLSFPLASAEEIVKVNGRLQADPGYYNFVVMEFRARYLEKFEQGWKAIFSALFCESAMDSFHDGTARMSCHTMKIFGQVLYDAFSDQPEASVEQEFKEWMHAVRNKSRGMQSRSKQRTKREEATEDEEEMLIESVSLSSAFSDAAADGGSDEENDMDETTPQAPPVPPTVSIGPSSDTSSTKVDVLEKRLVQSTTELKQVKSQMSTLLSKLDSLSSALNRNAAAQAPPNYMEQGYMNPTGSVPVMSAPFHYPISEPSLPFDFPFETVEQVKKFDFWLDTRENLTLATQVFSIKMRDKDLGRASSVFLDKIFSENLASQFSKTGQSRFGAVKHSFVSNQNIFRLYKDCFAIKGVPYSKMLEAKMSQWFANKGRFKGEKSDQFESVLLPPQDISIIKGERPDPSDTEYPEEVGFHADYNVSSESLDYA